MKGPAGEQPLRLRRERNLGLLAINSEFSSLKSILDPRFVVWGHPLQSLSFVPVRKLVSADFPSFSVILPSSRSPKTGRSQSDDCRCVPGQSDPSVTNYAKLLLGDSAQRPPRVRDTTGVAQIADRFQLAPGMAEWANPGQVEIVLGNSARS